MSNNKRSKSRDSGGEGFIGNLFGRGKMLSAEVTEEQDWYMDVPNLRLTRIFSIVLILHVVAVGGILAFKMIEKASSPVEEVVKTTPKENKKEQAQPATTGGELAHTAATGAKVVPEKEDSLIVDDPSRDGMQQYRVRSGETVADIARELQVSAAELMHLNQLDKGDKLYPGKWLTIPERKVSTQVPGSADELLTRTSAPEAPVARPVQQEPIQAKPVSAPPKATPQPRPEAPQVVAQQTPKVETPAPGGPVKLRPVQPVGRTATPAPAPAPVASPGSNKGTYVVKPGDTAYRIARKYGVDLQNLLAVNGIEDASRMQAGQVLTIPQH